jgi:TFIIF-interacting CTD phosphatase-like protein
MNFLKLTLASSVLISSCAKERTSDSPTSVVNKSESLELKLAPYKSPCPALQLRWCLTVLKDDGKAEFFYDSIENFQYKTGYSYQLSVSRVELVNPPADASAYQYTLKEILAETEDRRNFSFPVNPRWFDIENNQVSLIGETILVDDPQVLEQLISWRNEVSVDSGYIGETFFSWTENGKMKLTGVKKSL